jgi:hypothetical protein
MGPSCRPRSKTAVLLDGVPALRHSLWLLSPSLTLVSALPPRRTSTRSAPSHPSTRSERFPACITRPAHTPVACPNPLAAPRGRRSRARAGLPRTSRTGRPRAVARGLANSAHPSTASAGAPASARPPARAGRGRRAAHPQPAARAGDGTAREGRHPGRVAPTLRPRQAPCPRAPAGHELPPCRPARRRARSRQAPLPPDPEAARHRGTHGPTRPRRLRMACPAARGSARRAAPLAGASGPLGLRGP